METLNVVSQKDGNPTELLALDLGVLPKRRTNQLQMETNWATVFHLAAVSALLLFAAYSYFGGGQ